eukprot:Skav206029  [mRNA]  locus=scaffold1314:346221:358442:+ [translate_table: standard]
MLAAATGPADPRADRAMTVLRTSRLWERRAKVAPSLTVSTETELCASPTFDSIREAYDLDALLGRGAVGLVYKARRRADGRQVVVKVRNFIDKEVARSCRREFEVLQQLSHPHIITALDFLEISTGSQGETALIFDYCCDGTLQSIVKQSYPGGLPSSTLQPLSKMLCEAVAYLHSRRIVHRDIKADNVLLSESLDRLWLADFNTACQLMHGWALSMTGTMDYSAPEAPCRGGSRGGTADVWSLGLTYHFMARGKLPRRLDDFGGHLDAFAHAVAARPVKMQGPEWNLVAPQRQRCNGRWLVDGVAELFVDDYQL